jgi:photosystem II stability/assembly factor-like uncharacterized protein
MRTSFFLLTLIALASTTLLASAPDAGVPMPSRAIAAKSQQVGPTVTIQQSGTLNRLQAISPVTPQIVWASGLGGTFVVTTDGGNAWRAGVVPGAEALQFRDVEGVNARVA